jgi:hypothetical protein
MSTERLRRLLLALEICACWNLRPLSNRTGPVRAQAGCAKIHLHLYTDDVKDLEFFLLNRQVPFRA